MFLSRRNGIYHLFYRDDSGRRRSRSTGVRTKPEAVEYLRSFNILEATRRQGLKPITLSSFQDSFRIYSKAVHTSKTTRSSIIAIRVFSCFIGPDVAMHTITAGDCERFLASKVGNVSPYTLRYYFLALCASFERAFAWGHVQVNPWRKVKKPKTPQVLPAYFTRDQFTLLLSKLKDRDLRELVIFAVMTGLRLGELLAMRWEWIDFSCRLVTVQNSDIFTTKSKRARIVPLSDEALKVLLARRERRSEVNPAVFTRNGRVMDGTRESKKLKKAVRSVGLPETLHFHSLRHSFASWLVQGGVSLYQVSRFLGHSSTAVTEQYAHLVPSDMHSVLAPLHFEN